MSFDLSDHLEHNGQSGRSGGTAAVFVSLSSQGRARLAQKRKGVRQFGLVAQLVRARA